MQHEAAAQFNWSTGSRATARTEPGQDAAQPKPARRPVPASTANYQARKVDANERLVTIMGSQASTGYTKLAEDIQSALDDPNGSLRVLPILGKGGGQNLLDILFLKNIDMGIVDEDAMGFFKAKDPQLYGDLEKRVQYITKLANAEMHLFVRPEVKSLADLRGKKVSFFKQYSSTHLAIEKILKICGIESEGLFMDQDLAAQRLRTGDLSGIARVSAAPTGIFDKFVPEDGYFLPLDATTLPDCYGKLLEHYLPSALKNEDYPRLIAADKPVPSVAYSIVLAVYAWPKGTERYARVEHFVQAFFSRIDELRKPPRHPKWKDINLAAEVPGWIRFRAAQEWLDANSATVGTSAEAKNAFVKFLGDQARADGNALTPRQRDALFDQFTAWWNSQRQQ